MYVLANVAVQNRELTTTLDDDKDLYQVQRTLKKLCGFSTVWADRADLGSTKTAKLKLKYATFEASFVMFSWAKNHFGKYNLMCVRKKSFHVSCT